MPPLEHADKLVKRALKPGGEPILKSKDGTATRPFKAPYIINVLDQDIKGQQYAIQVYSQPLEPTKKKDPITYNEDLRALKELPETGRSQL